MSIMNMSLCVEYFAIMFARPNNTMSYDGQILHKQKNLTVKAFSCILYFRSKYCISPNIKHECSVQQETYIPWTFLSFLLCLKGSFCSCGKGRSKRKRALCPLVCSSIIIILGQNSTQHDYRIKLQAHDQVYQCTWM